MAERRTRRRFTAEFKAEAVEQLLDGGKGLAEVAAELGLSPGQLSGWRNEHLAAGSAKALAARKAELQRLKRENKLLEEEVEILRKAAAFFARARAEAEAERRGHVGRIFAGRRRAYGSRRVHAEPRREGRRHSRRRVEQLMCEMGLRARRGRRRPPRTADSRHDLPVAPNLLDRLLDADRPDTVWLADISYPPADEGWL